MKIALLGYGKMGKAIENFAILRGHEVVLKVSAENRSLLSFGDFENVDVAIEFSTPKTALDNIQLCFATDTPVIVGTTGEWLDNFYDLKALYQKNQSLFFASNYSIGMNIVFEMNKKLAAIMEQQEDYEVTIDETHHIHKLDEPSGTAITLAEGIIAKSSKKTNWKLNLGVPDDVIIKAHREGEVPGTHLVKYHSEVDDIELSHTAHNRDGFAKGAVIAAEWIIGKTGFFGMEDLLKL